MWQSFYYFGEFLGSTFGGFFVEKFGFPWTAVLPITGSCCLIIYDTVMYIIDWFLKQQCLEDECSDLETTVLTLKGVKYNDNMHDRK
jgi:hypothetical protein